jgi:hypothetical protein
MCTAVKNASAARSRAAREQALDVLARHHHPQRAFDRVRRSRGCCGVDATSSISASRARNTHHAEPMR